MKKNCCLRSRFWHSAPAMQHDAASVPDANCRCPAHEVDCTCNRQGKQSVSCSMSAIQLGCFSTGPSPMGKASARLLLIQTSNLRAYGRHNQQEYFHCICVCRGESSGIGGRDACVAVLSPTQHARISPAQSSSCRSSMSKLFLTLWMHG